MNSQLMLGIAYELGVDTLPDPEQAAYWFRKASDQGNPSAAYRLGLHYEEGLGVPQNYLEAANLYRASAKKGDDQGQRALAEMYRLGLGVSKNITQALLWYEATECAEPPAKRKPLAIADAQAIRPSCRPAVIACTRLLTASLE